jgi:hypothetical protein
MQNTLIVNEITAEIEDATRLSLLNVEYSPHLSLPHFGLNKILSLLYYTVNQPTRIRHGYVYIINIPLCQITSQCSHHEV